MAPHAPGRLKRGFTVLEVLIAITVFGFVFAALLKAITTADRIRGRSSQFQQATALAGDEIERIRNMAAFHDVITDSSYEVSVDGRTFSVVRKVVVADDGLPAPLQVAGDEPVEIELSVKGSGPDSPTLTFRLLQGYAQ